MNVELNPSSPVAWGKLSRSDGRSWHPLIMHMIDVMAVALELIERKCVANTFGGLSTVQKKQIAFLVAIHDIGKHNNAFQAKAYPALNTYPNHAGHVAEGLALFVDYTLQSLTDPTQPTDVSFYTICEEWFGDDEKLLRDYLNASISHHGAPTEVKLGTEYRKYWDVSKHKLQLTQTMNVLAKLCGLVFDSSNPSNQTKFEALPSSNHFIHSFCGFVTLCDWLGSDVSFFPYTDCSLEDLLSFDSLLALATDRMSKARASAKLFINKLGWDYLESFTPSKEHLSRVLKTQSFSEIFPFPKLKPFQQDIFDSFVHEKGVIEIVEAQTGDGKTEAAFLRFCQNYDAGLADGLVFLLPTRSSAHQLHSRIEEIVSKLFHLGAPDVVLAVPGFDRTINNPSNVNALPESNVLYDDSDPLHRIARKWADSTSKRFLAGTFVVGTIDQVLLSTLKVKHSHMRSFCLSRLYLVVDEVHASDTYMTELLKEVLENHRNAEGNTLLLSATITDSKKEELLLVPKASRLSDMNALTKIEYPLLSRTSTRNPSLVERVPLTAGSKKEFFTHILEHNDIKKVLELAISSAKQGANVLILRNTVKDCMRTQRLLESEVLKQGCSQLLFMVAGKPVPHHSLFTASDRQLLDKMLVARYGKNGQGEGSIVVATQTIQQSLDIDFDLMITDLCPMDVLIQRAGRLHRHTKSRLPGFKEANLYVLAPDTFFGAVPLDGMYQNGFGTVYLDFLMLEATLRELKRDSHFLLGDQARLRIEASLNPHVIENIKNTLSSFHLRLLEDNQNKIGSERIVAKSTASEVKCNWDIEYSSSKNLFPKATEEAIFTRLGERPVSVSIEGFGFTKKALSPLGSTFYEFSLPQHLFDKGYLLSDVDIVATDFKEETSGNERYYEFKIGTRKYQYSRLGFELVSI